MTITEMQEFLLPTTDSLFKFIFGHSDSMEILKDILSEVSEIPKENFKEITIVDPHQNPEAEGKKKSVLDIRAKMKDGTEIIFEMQKASHSYLNERLLYYAAKAYSTRLVRGAEYDRLPKVIAIMLCKQDHLNELSEKFHYKFKLIDEESGTIFSNKFEIHVILLSKVPKGVSAWYDFLNATNEEEVNMAAERNPIVNEAATKLRYFSADEARRLQAMHEQFYEMDQAQMLKEAEMNGKMEEKFEVAKKLIQMGMNVEFVKEASGLTESEIASIKEGLRSN